MFGSTPNQIFFNSFSSSESKTSSSLGFTLETTIPKFGLASERDFSKCSCVSIEERDLSCSFVFSFS